MQFKAIGELASHLFNRLSDQIPFDRQALEASGKDLRLLLEQWLKEAVTKLDLVPKDELVKQQQAFAELAEHTQALESQIAQMEARVQAKVGPLDDYVDQGSEGASAQN